MNGRLSELSGLNKRPSLLKNSIVELYEEEKRRKILSNDLNSHTFVSKKWYFALFKAHQFSFSTGWDGFRDRMVQIIGRFLRQSRRDLLAKELQIAEPLCAIASRYPDVQIIW
jgi:hypothetical protein